MSDGITDILGNQEIFSKIHYYMLKYKDTNPLKYLYKEY